MPEKRHLAASVALLGATALTGAAVTPPPPPQPPPVASRVVSADVSLTAAASVLNVPINFLIDLINVPQNEIRALDYTAKAFTFSGPWFVVGPTNVWGIDPGDPPKLMSLINTLVPFPALSGIDRDEFDQGGLGQQVWMFLATQLPTSVYCDDEGCMPTVPGAPITGIASIDNLIWGISVVTGLVKFPLFENWFRAQVPPGGFTFGPDWPGRVNPAGQIFPEFGFAGTEVDPETGEYIMPWDGMTYKMDLATPFQNYWEHLMSDPASNPITLPNLEQFARAIQSMAAALVIAFDPITPGSAFCPGRCESLPKALDYPGIVKFIGDLWPGNEVINDWLKNYENRTANVPTDEQIDLAVQLKESHFWDFTFPSPPADWMKVFNFSSLAPAFHALWTALGLRPPPLNTDKVDPSLEPDPTPPPTTGNNNLLSLMRSSDEKTTAEVSGQSPTAPDDARPAGDTKSVAAQRYLTDDVAPEPKPDDQDTVPVVNGGAAKVQEQKEADAGGETNVKAGPDGARQPTGDLQDAEGESGRHGPVSGDDGKDGVGTAGQGDANEPAGGTAGQGDTSDPDDAQSGGGTAAEHNTGTTNDSNTGDAGNGSGNSGGDSAGGQHRAA